MNTLAKSSEPLSRDAERKVRILDDVVVNQIAAGEVVERPSSVVKELIENSIDAGATEISIAVTNGGKTSIEISDNGCGMSRENALFAVERFGTSKIQTVGDLERIASHGFRGEALPSIASVSRFSLETKPWGDDSSGTEILIDGGKLIEARTKPIAPGTRITVRNLFYNVPARKKFLRSENTEEGLIRSLLIDFASAYPHLRLRFASDGVERSVLLPGENFFVKAKELKIAGEKPILVDYQQATAAGPVVVHAVLSQPIECVSQSGRLRLLVNRRSVRDKLLLKAIRDGYGAYLRPGRYPMGVISIELPPEDVDVNVHPQKTEVRFRRPEVIFQTIVGGLKSALGASSALSPAALHSSNSDSIGYQRPPINSGSFTSEVRFFSGDAESTPSNAETITLFSRPPILLSPRSDHAEVGVPSSQELRASQNSQYAVIPSSQTGARGNEKSIRHMRFVGQVLACYLIFEGGESVAIMDMHAAHERVMFFRLKQQFVGGNIHSQQLLIPEVVELGGSVCEFVEKNLESLQKIGFELDRLNAGAVSLRALPSMLSAGSGRALLHDLLSEPDFTDWLTVLGERVDAVLARMACHRSVRSGRILNGEEAYALVEALDDAEISGLCPHGRPTVRFLSKNDFEEMFGRVL